MLATSIMQHANKPHMLATFLPSATFACIRQQVLTSMP